MEMECRRDRQESDIVTTSRYITKRKQFTKSEQKKHVKRCSLAPVTHCYEHSDPRLMLHSLTHPFYMLCALTYIDKEKCQQLQVS